MAELLAASGPHDLGARGAARLLGGLPGVTGRLVAHGATLGSLLRSRACRRAPGGGRGDEAVAAQLEMLAGVGWHVVEGARSAAPGSAVDQMLIGSGGVYTLSTKSHPGAKIWVGEQAILVDRHKTPYLRNSRSDAERAAVLLSRAVDRPVEVRAALVLGHGSPPSEVRFAGRPADVLVLDAWQLSGALRRTPRRLSEHDVVELVAAARRPETWD